MQDSCVAAASAGFAKDDDIARLAARLAMEHFLRTALGLANMLPGEDLLTMLVHRAIVTANLAHLDVDPSVRQYATLAAAPPDEVRRPVSVRAIAASVGIPFENVRRRVQRLVELGLCRRVRGGMILPAVSLEGPEAELALLANMAGLRRLFRRLESAGFDLSGDASSPRLRRPVAEADTRLAHEDNGD
ncbi:hypothetical protein [uncultured Phenylobacterium sp.]|uniref:hypothetical protein n=1 Tax=uncultured Phenylobacterium sp. TaxID=349273 RepID=UPI0025DC4693|nr:hypothetical protein [uncultured Phenylobacterium sp.]